MCSAISCGSVYSFSSYMILVGDVRVRLLDGSTEFSILVCALGLFLFSSKPSIMCSLFARLMSLLSLFLYFLCAVILSGVGLSVLI